MSWLSNAWDGISEFTMDTIDGAKAAGAVIWNDPGHAAAVFIDGVEQGAADIGGLIIGGVPDLVDWGAEKAFGVNLYDGSLSNAVSGGLKWGIDGIEGLAGIEQPVIMGNGDEFLFGAGRLTGQVVTGAAAVGGAGAIWSATKGVASGAWWVAANSYKVAAATSLAANGAVLGGGALVGADMVYNDGRITGGAVQTVVDYGIEKVTGYEGLTDAWNQVAPEGLKEALTSFMSFMGSNPMLAKWGSFGLTLLLGNSLVGGLTGNMPFGGLVSLAISGALAWGISNAFEKAAVSAYNEQQGAASAVPQQPEDGAVYASVPATVPNPMGAMV